MAHEMYTERAQMRIDAEVLKNVRAGGVGELSHGTSGALMFIPRSVAVAAVAALLEEADARLRSAIGPVDDASHREDDDVRLRSAVGLLVDFEAVALRAKRFLRDEMQATRAPLVPCGFEWRHDGGRARYRCNRASGHEGGHVDSTYISPLAKIDRGPHDL